MIKNRIVKKIVGVFFAFIPAIAFALDKTATVETLFNRINEVILIPVINFLLVLATLVFLWGVIQYVLAADNSSKIEGAKKQILWGIIGLTVMGSAWTIVNLLKSSISGL